MTVLFFSFNNSGRRNGHSAGAWKAYNNYREQVLAALDATRCGDLRDCEKVFQLIKNHTNVFGRHVERLKLQREFAESSKKIEKMKVCSNKPTTSSSSYLKGRIFQRYCRQRRLEANRARALKKLLEIRKARRVNGGIHGRVVMIEPQRGSEADGTAPENSQRGINPDHLDSNVLNAGGNDRPRGQERNVMLESNEVNSDSPEWILVDDRSRDRGGRRNAFDRSGRNEYANLRSSSARRPTWDNRSRQSGNGNVAENYREISIRQRIDFCSRLERLAAHFRRRLSRSLRAPPEEFERNVASHNDLPRSVSGFHLRRPPCCRCRGRGEANDFQN